MNTITISIDDYNELHEAQVILNCLKKAITDGSVASYNIGTFVVALLNIKEDA